MARDKRKRPRPRTPGTGRSMETSGVVPAAEALPAPPEEAVFSAAEEESPESPVPFRRSLTDIPFEDGPNSRSEEGPQKIEPSEKSPKAESGPEDTARTELNKAIEDFWAKRSQISEMRAKKTGRFASLAKSLGIKTKNLSEDPEVMGLEKESHDLYRNLLSKGIHLYKGDKPQLENFLKQFDEFEVFRQAQNQEMDERAKNCKWPETVLAGFQKIGQKWSEMSWKKKLLIGGAAGGLMTVGAIALGAGTFGAAALGAGYRWGFRGFGAMAAGVGRKVQLDVKLIKEIEANQDMRFQQKMNFLKQYENNIDQGIEQIILDGAGIKYARKEYEQRSLENTIRARNLALKTFAISSIIGESFRYASQATGINLGTILKKIGGAVGSGGGAEWQPVDGNMQGLPSIEQSAGTAKLSPQDFDQIQKALEANPSGKHAEDLANEINKLHGGTVEPGAPETPASGGAPAPEIQKPQFEDVPVKIKAGGNMWASIESKIKANPSAYGLDKTDPQFKAKMNGRIAEMLHDFADKKGISYKQLDKVFEGDNFKIKHDMAGNPYLDDFQGKAFGGNVSQAAPLEENTLNKPKLAPENTVKPRASAVDHQPTRSAGKTMKYEPDTPEQIKAKTRWAQAVQNEENLARIKAEFGSQLEQAGDAAHLKQFVATRGLLNRIVEETGVGSRANFWDQPMNSWSKMLGSEFHVSQDVLHNDATDKTNISLDKLRKLYPILRKYQTNGAESIGECLFKAMKDPMNVLDINRLMGR